MGGLVVESEKDLLRTEEFHVDDDVKDSKKKRRRSRKSKQPISASSSVAEICMDASNLPGEHHVESNGHYLLPQECNTSSHHETSDGHRQLSNEPNAGLSLMLLLNANVPASGENLQHQQPFSHDIKNTIISVPEPVPCEEPVESVMMAKPVDCQSRQKCFSPHLSEEAVTKALENGELLRALFHVNAHNRLEAYCRIDGVQTDVLISGLASQNRAIEGDTVGIVIDPPSLWPRMKGSNETLNNSVGHNNSHGAISTVHDCLKGKSKLCPESEHDTSNNDAIIAEEGFHYTNGSSHEAIPDSCFNEVLDNDYTCCCQQSISDAARSCCSSGACNSTNSLERLCTLISLFPSKRPTGKVVAILERSMRRDTVVGFLSVKQWIFSRESKKKNSRKNKHQSDLYNGYILLMPTDPKFSKMMVPVRILPASIKKRLVAGDTTLEYDLVGAKIIDWAEECYIPDARVTDVFGRGSDIEAQLAAILFESAIDASEFSPEVLSCIPHIPWEIPKEELQSRRELRDMCIFTIDPTDATDLDDALSVERLSDGVFRVGVHIADVSYFVRPDSSLDIDSQIRSTSVYLLKRKLPMLPPLLSVDLASLNPGVDRLAFSIFWYINTSGEVLDNWIGRSVLRSCCKLSYDHAQEIIDGTINFENSSQVIGHWPKLYGQLEWSDVVKSVKSLYEISKVLRENRFKDGALSLESPKIGFLFDRAGMPFESMICGRKESNVLVEEFMLLANRTAAEVITRAYPSCALLRRHPEPNARKLHEFEAFCQKHGLKLDISSSARLHQSLEHIRGELKHDSVLFDIVMSYAARPMQLAAYFCSGDSKDASDLFHYALALPFYTHFTSPLRRYPDIVVHRTLAAALEAEDMYLNYKRAVHKIPDDAPLSRCFTGICFDKDELGSRQAQEALSIAASKHRVPGAETLADVAAYCNQKKRATRHVKDATDKLYMWALLKKKEVLFSEARVLGLGPKFMSIYIPKLAIERRIYYDEVEGLTVQWLDTTSTLMLCYSGHKRLGRKGSPGKCRTLEDVAVIVNPADVKLDMELSEQLQRCDLSEMANHEPVFFPLTVHLLSTIPVALHAIGGDDGPLDIVARLYACSYFQ